MLNEEKFKELLNSKLGEEQFPFDESNWPGAEALLDAEKKRRGGIYYLLPLLILVGGILAYMIWPVDTTANKLATKTVEAPILETPKTETPANDVVIEPKIAEPKIVKVVSRETSPKKTTTVPSAKVEAPAKETVLPVKETIMESPVTVNELPIKQKESLPENHATGPQVLVNETPVQITAVTPSVPSVTASNDATKTTTPEIMAVNTGLSTVISETPKATVVAETPKATVQEETIAVKETTTSNAPEATKTIAPVAEEKTHVTVETNTVMQQEKPKLDTVVNASVAAVPEPTGLLWIDFGTAYNFGYKQNGVKEGNAFNPTFGLQFMTMVKGNYAFTFGIQYQSIRGLHLSKHESKVTRYGLGEDNFVTVISPSTAHYLYLPLRVSYKYKEKNIFSLGYQVGYLLNVDSKVETYNEHFNSVDSYTTYHTGGYTEGFAMFDHQLALGYRRKLYKDFWINTEAYYGLTDIKNNVFFGSNVFDRNSGLKISLMYQVFKK